ncbi:hypothetical protein M0804_014669 [Polistes exclamans]|nr:hypothetical protein M0804_014669 [Polistes exclamans]
MFLFKIIKLVVDSILRGYALHTVYGWSIHLLGAIWGSITGLLLQLRNSKDRRAASTETELREITREQSETVNSLPDNNPPTTATSSSQTEGSPAEMETSLTRLLLSKLSSHAYLVTEGLRINKVECLIERLKDAFLPSRGSNYYRGQLAMEFMKPGEHMLYYFSRIKELTQSILDETTKSSVHVERRVELAIEREGLDALIRGLPRDYKTALKFEYYSNFDGILVCLLRIDKQIKEEDSKMGISMAENRVANIKPINKSINCSYCKRDGHLEDSCWQKKETGTVGIRQVKYNPRWESPCVTGFSPRLTGNVILMIDTGAEVNLLKKNCIKPSTKIDGTDLLQLTGITLEKQSTLEGYMPLLQLPAGIYAGKALIKNNNGKGFFKITNTTSKQYMFEIPRLELSDFSEDTLLNSGSDNGSKTTDPDSSEILSFIHTIFTEKNGEECPKLNTFEVKPSF